MMIALMSGLLGSVLRFICFSLLGIDLIVTFTSSSVGIRITGALKISFMLHSWNWLDVVRIVLGYEPLGRTTVLMVDIWMQKGFLMPKFGGNPDLSWYAWRLSCFFSEIVLTIYVDGSASPLNLTALSVKCNLSDEENCRSCAIRVGEFTMAIGTNNEDDDGRRVFCKGREFSLDLSKGRLSLTLQTVILDFFVIDAPRFLYLAESLSVDSGSLFVAPRRSEKLVRFMRASRDITNKDRMLVSMSVKSFEVSVTSCSEEGCRVNLSTVTGPISLQMESEHPRWRAWICTGFIATHLSHDHLESTMCLFKVNRYIGSTNRNIEGHVELYTGGSHSEMSLTICCSEVINLHLPVQAILMMSSHLCRKDTQSSMLRRLMCSSLTTLCRVSIQLPELRLIFDDHEKGNSVFQIDAPRFALRQEDSLVAKDSCHSLTAILETEACTLKTPNGRIVFSCTDTAVTCALTCSPETLRITLRKLQINSLSLALASIIVSVGLLEFDNDWEPAARMALRSLSCVIMKEQVRGELGSLLLCFGFTPDEYSGSVLKLARAVFRDIKMAGVKGRTSFNIDVGEADMRLSLQRNRTVRLLYSMLDITPPPPPRSSVLNDTLSDPINSTQRVFPEYFPLISWMDQVLSPVTSSSLVTMLMGHVIAARFQVALPQHASLLVELPCLSIERFEQPRGDIPSSMHSFWLLELRHHFRAFISRDNSRRRLFLHVTMPPEDICLRVSMAQYTDGCSSVSSSKLYATPLGVFHINIDNEHLAVLRNLLVELLSSITPRHAQSHDASRALDFNVNRVVILPLLLNVNRMLTITFYRQIIRSSTDFLSWLRNVSIEMRRFQDHSFVHHIK